MAIQQDDSGDGADLDYGCECSPGQSCNCWGTEPKPKGRGRWLKRLVKELITMGLAQAEQDRFWALVVGTEYHTVIQLIRDGTKWVTLTDRKTLAGKPYPNAELTPDKLMAHVTAAITGNDPRRQPTVICYGIRWNRYRYRRRHRRLNGLNCNKREAVGTHLILDVDDHDKRGDALARTEAICLVLVAMGCRPVVLKTKRGYHIWMWLDQERSVPERVTMGLALLDAAGVSHDRVDIRPDLAGHGIRIPLQPGQSIHQPDPEGNLMPVTGGHQYDPWARDATVKWASRAIPAFNQAAAHAIYPTDSTPANGARIQDNLCADRAIHPTDSIDVSTVSVPIPPPDQSPPSSRPTSQTPWTQRVVPLHAELMAAMSTPPNRDASAPAGRSSVTDVTLLRDMYQNRGLDIEASVRWACLAAQDASKAGEFRAYLHRLDPAIRRCQPVAMPVPEGQSPELSLVMAMDYLKTLRGAPVHKSIEVELSMNVIRGVTGLGEHKARAARDRLIAAGILVPSRCYRRGVHGNMYRYVDPRYAMQVTDAVCPGAPPAHVEVDGKPQGLGAGRLIARVLLSGARLGSSSRRHYERIAFPLAPPASDGACTRGHRRYERGPPGRYQGDTDGPPPPGDGTIPF